MGTYPALYRQIFASPHEIVAALFSTGLPGASGGKESSRMNKYLKVVEKKVNGTQVYVRAQAESSFLTDLFPKKSSVEVWVNGRRDRPLGPWKVRVESAGQKFEGQAWLRENPAGAMLEFQLMESSIGETLTRASLKMARASGIVEDEPERAAGKTGK